MDNNVAAITRVRVRYAETDQMGVAYHANYLVWMEIGRVELVRSRGADYKKIEQEGLLLAVVEAQCRYLAPARYDDEIEVETRLAALTSRTIDFSYTLRLAGTMQVLANGSTRHMWLNRSLRPARLPERYQQMFQVGFESE